MKWMFFMEILKAKKRLDGNNLVSSTTFRYVEDVTTDFYDCFSGVFIVDCICSCHQLSLPWLFFCYFLSGTLFVLLYRECHGFERAFFTLRCFYLTPLPDIWHKFTRQTWSICLFESYSVQEKVLVSVQGTKQRNAS